MYCFWHCEHLPFFMGHLVLSYTDRTRFGIDLCWSTFLVEDLSIEWQFYQLYQRFQQQLAQSGLLRRVSICHVTGNFRFLILTHQNGCNPMDIDCSTSHLLDCSCSLSHDSRYFLCHCRYIASRICQFERRWWFEHWSITKWGHCENNSLVMSVLLSVCIVMYVKCIFMCILKCVFICVC